MNDSRTDEGLVTDHIGGDRTALAAIYDRYADRLYDTAAMMLSDRHEAADVMQDVFLIAATRLDQLRDGSRLKPWLFAILRNQVYTRSKGRRRVVATDFSAPETAEMAAPIDPRAEGAGLAYTELADLMRSAAAGLDQRDQLVLEYSLRQDLTGNDLADALGVSLDQSYVVVSRMRDRVERTIGALTVARMGRKDCAQLAEVLQGWDGTFSVLIRKRVARHIEQCDTCERTKKAFAVIPMMSAAPALAAPPDLRERVLRLAGSAPPAYDYGFDEAGGFPGPVTAGRKRFAVVALAIVAVVLLLGGGIAIGLAGDDSSGAPVVATDPTAAESTTPSDDSSVPAATSPSPFPSSPSTPSSSPEASTTTTVADATTVPEVSTTVVATSSTAPAVTATSAAPPVVTAAPPAVPPVPTVPPLPPGQLDLSAGVVDLGGALQSGSVTLANSGQQPVSWAFGNGPEPFTASATAGSLAPGQSVVVSFGVNRAAVPEGVVARDVAITSSAGGGGVVQVRATADHAPQVGIVQGAPSPTCPPIEVPTVVAAVSDESPITSAVLSWTGPGNSGSAPMTAGGGNWSAPLGVDYVEGLWTFVVRITDSRGNVGTATGTTQVLCPTPG